MDIISLKFQSYIKNESGDSYRFVYFLCTSFSTYFLLALSSNITISHLPYIKLEAFWNLA